MVLTRSHDISSGVCGPGVVDKPVIVRAGAWIGSRAILYNCEIKAGAIVAAGAVVKSMTVEAGTIVAGNPAVVVKRFIKGKWRGA